MRDGGAEHHRSSRRKRIPGTESVYEQLRKQMQDDITNALQAAKDSGAFDGADGEAATVAVSRTVTLPSGSDASVSNEGTDTNARLVFGIPRGARVIPANAAEAAYMSLQTAKRNRIFPQMQR